MTTHLPLMSSLFPRLLGAWRLHGDRAAVFEHVDSRLLDGEAFRASDSMGLDGAPSMVFLDAMPPYSRALDRPSAQSA